MNYRRYYHYRKKYRDDPNFVEISDYCWADNKKERDNIMNQLAIKTAIESFLYNVWMSRSRTARQCAWTSRRWAACQCAWMSRRQAARQYAWTSRRWAAHQCAWTSRRRAARQCAWTNRRWAAHPQLYSTRDISILEYRA